MPVSPKANLQLIYVTDIERSTAFYSMLFNAEPVFSSPRYVAFNVEGGALFALWTGGATPDLAVPRFSEIGIMLSSDEAVGDLYHAWKDNTDIEIAQEPTVEVFGLTFLVRDPDGHIIRVCSVDK
jgi:predicted enzyme related to lactoylglutathione lyase